MALRVDATQWLQKWGTNLGAAGSYIKAGVQRVQTAPGVSAAAAADRMLAGIQAAVSSGMWAKRVSAIPLNVWQDAMINKAIPRLQQGITSAQKNKVPIITALLSTVEAAQSAANALPKGGIQNSIQRAAAFMTYMHDNAPRLKG